MVIFLIFVYKNVYRIRFHKIKIGPLKGFEKKAFFSLSLMRKRLSGGQKWFLKPYFPLISGTFVFRSGLRFSFRALEVPKPRVRKRPLWKVKADFSLLSVWALPSFWQLMLQFILYIGQRIQFQTESRYGNFQEHVYMSFLGGGAGGGVEGFSIDCELYLCFSLDSERSRWKEIFSHPRQKITTVCFVVIGSLIIYLYHS